MILSSLKLALIQSGVLREKGRTILWKSVQEGCPVPTGVPSSALPQCPKPPLRNGGLAVPVGTVRCKSCSIGPEASRVHPAEAGQGHLWFRSGGPEAKHHAGNLDLQPARSSIPSASRSPSPFLHPTSSVFEVKVKRANVPE